MTHEENLKMVEKIFGKPLGRFPDIFPTWDGPKGTAFWASSHHWNSMKLRDESSCRFDWFPGPRRAEAVPFTVKPNEDGYLVFVPDEE
ncbi:MAG: hypothetical protein J6C46_05605 [Clostridia bacterium]|nr:hypothetical protein [Clostridia bacterium]